MEASVLKLPRELTIFTVEIFWKTLVETIETMVQDGEKKLVLYFGGLEKIDGSGVQLLLSLEKTMLKEDFQVKYIDIDDSIKKTFKLIGVEYLLTMAGDSIE